MSPRAILRFLHFRSRTGLGFLGAFFLLVTARPTPSWLLAGGGIALVGAAVRFWASGTLCKDEVLARTGPYALTRNPLYLGSIIIAIGFAAANRNVYFAIIAGVAFGVLYARTIRKEERKLLAAFGEDFEAFSREVPPLVPVPWRLPAREKLRGDFRVRRALGNQEGEAILGIFGLLLLLSYPAFTGKVALFRVIVSIGMGAFLVGRAGLFPILRSDSKNRFVQILRYAFSRKKYEKLRS